ncbi:MAG: hypothetical protein QGG89_16825, partial [Vicinamibacterales bacterium]|nr:hypothetical protein [Vicinamibacterales bacterium]
MFAKRWVQWLSVLLILAVFGGGVGALLIGQGLPLAGNVVLVITSVILHLWLAGGIFAWVQTRWLLWLMIYEGVPLLIMLIAIPLALTGSIDAAMFLSGVAVAARLVIVGR